MFKPSPIALSREERIHDARNRLSVCRERGILDYIEEKCPYKVPSNLHQEAAKQAEEYFDFPESWDDFLLENATKVDHFLNGFIPKPDHMKERRTDKIFLKDFVIRWLF